MDIHFKLFQSAYFEKASYCEVFYFISNYEFFWLIPIVETRNIFKKKYNKL